MALQVIEERGEPSCWTLSQQTSDSTWSFLVGSVQPGGSWSSLFSGHVSDSVKITMPMHGPYSTLRVYLK